MVKALRSDVVSDSCSLMALVSEVLNWSEVRNARGTHRGHERLDEFRRVRDEELEVLVDLKDGHDGVLADVAVAVLEARAARRDQGLEQLRLADLLEETQRRATDVLVRVLLHSGRGVSTGARPCLRPTEAVGHTRSLRMALLHKAARSAGVEWARAREHAPDENHLLLELAILVELGADLPVEACLLYTSPSPRDS